MKSKGQPRLLAASSVAARSSNLLTAAARERGVHLILDHEGQVEESSETDNIMDAHLTVSVRPVGIQVEASHLLDGPFANAAEAVLDEAAKTITIPLPVLTTFWRLRSATPMRIAEIRIQGDSVVLRYSE